MNQQEREKIAAINSYAAALESELDEVYLDEDVDLGVSLTAQQLKNLKLSHVAKLRGKNKIRFEERCRMQYILAESGHSIDS